MKTFGVKFVAILVLLQAVYGGSSKLTPVGNCKNNEYYNKSHGFITSPGYPNHYPTSFCKIWFITGVTNDIITISFQTYDIEAGILGSCDHDYLYIGPKPEVKICGKMGTIPKVYISTLKHVKIHFYSDAMTTGTGFELKYIMGPVKLHTCDHSDAHCNSGKCIYPEWKCNGAQECADGSDEANCPHGTPVPITPVVAKCPNNTLLCQDIITEIKICVPKNKWCDGEKNCLQGEDEAKTMCPSSKCNSQIDRQSGYVISPNFPHDYPPNLDCYWTIHIQGLAAQVQLRFVKFDLQTEPNTDFLTVYDGTYLDGKLIGTYYGKLSDTTEPVESKSDYITMRFHTDKSGSGSGFNITYQKKGVCLPDQLPCGSTENDCYPKTKRCDGHWNCPIHGGDEKGCGHCGKDQLRCGLDGHQCYEEKQRCDGMSRCTDLDDELNCNSVLCGAHNGTFLCNNKRCIYETWKCDKTDDCGDNSDEVNCPRSTNLITIAAVAGSLICSLLLVIAMGCTCKLYNLRMQQFHGPRHETPLTRLYAEFMRRRAPPPYHEAMLTSRPYEEVRQELAEQTNRNETSGSRTRRHRRRTARLARHVQRTSDNLPAQSTEQNVNNDTGTLTDSQTHANVDTGQSSQDVNSSNLTWNTDSHSSTLALIPDDSSDTTEGPDESGDESDQQDGEHVSFSGSLGITARWQCPRNSGKQGDESEHLLQVDPPCSPPSAGGGSGDVTTSSCDSVNPSPIIARTGHSGDCGDDSDKSCDHDLPDASSSLDCNDDNLISLNRDSDETQHESSQSTSDTDAITLAESLSGSI